MNLKERMSRTFSDFWNVNLGHVAIVFTFVFGLGISWQKASDKIDRVQDLVAIKHESALQMIAASNIERDLKFTAFSERLLKDETQISVISDLRVSIAQIATEMHGINSQLVAFRQEIQDRRKPE